MKPVNLKPSTYVDSSEEINGKDPKFKIGDIVEILKCKNILTKAMFRMAPKTFLWLKKLKTLCRGHILLVSLKTKKLLESFTKTNCKKQIKKTSKSNKEKVINYMLNGKVMIVLLTVKLIKKDIV